MTFSEKLDFLMNLTKTRNSALAFHTSLDASHISRLRNGGRKPAKKENYIKVMTEYFAKHCTEEYQTAALRDVLKIPSSLPNDYKKTAKLIYHWLFDERDDESKRVEGFLNKLSNFQFKKNPQAQPDEVQTKAADPFSSTCVPPMDTSIYYGIEGKREAVLFFLSLVIQAHVPQTLLLFSDEDMDWLVESREFTAKWAALMSQVILRGNRIKIIHTVSRDLDEMLSAISEWMPLYMTGAIEPYYYPKKRDGVFKRTLFIAPDTAAVVSTSVGSMKSGANFFTRDEKAIDTLSEEYNNYLSLCRPLMHIFNAKNKQGYLAALTEFEKEEADSIIKTEALSIMTMPLSVVEQICSRVGNEQKKMVMAYHKKRTENFMKRLLKNYFHEIIKIPDMEKIQRGKVPVIFSDMLDQDGGLFYTPEEFAQHLENIAILLMTFERYHVCFSGEREDKGYLLYVKEDLGVMVAKTTPPSIIIAMNESNMTAAFWDYLTIKMDEAGKTKANKKQAIAKLNAVVNIIRGTVPLTGRNKLLMGNTINEKG